MEVKLSAELLEELEHSGSCYRGVFDAASARLADWFPDGWEGEWTPLHQAFFLSDQVFRCVWGQLVRCGVVPSYSLASVDLSGLNLDGVDFRGAILTNANLNGCSLGHSRFDGAVCDGADFSGAYMFGAKLHRSSFIGVKFEGANMRRVMAAGADFWGARFHGADLGDLGRNAQFARCKFRRAEFADASISYVQFDLCNLTEVKLSELGNSWGYHNNVPYKGKDTHPRLVLTGGRGEEHWVY